MENDQRRKWHINRGISVEAVLAFVVICSGLLVAWVDLNSRVSVQGAIITNLVSDALKRTDEAKIVAAEWRVRMDRMEDKIDQLRRDLLERKK